MFWSCFFFKILFIGQPNYFGKFQRNNHPCVVRRNAHRHFNVKVLEVFLISTRQDHL